MENGFVLYHLKSKSQYNTTTIETSKIKGIRFSIDDDALIPSLPCDGEIVSSKYSNNVMPVKLLEKEQNTIRYEKNGKANTKSLDNIYEIRFVIPNSIEKYNVKMYYYKRKGLTINF